jgi:hypothetical protein
MSARDELKALIDQIPPEKVASVRAAVEAVLHPSGRQSDSAEGESTGRTGAAAGKKYPERTPAGGIITPQ